MFLVFRVVTHALVGLGAEANPPLLTLKQAEELVVKANPRIDAGQLRAMAAKQAAREVRAGFFPSVAANATAVGTAWDNTRIAAGALNNPSIFERNGEGLIVNQLITDFGRTANLSSAAKARAEAEEMTAQATREQIMLQTDAAYFSALEAQSVMEVARQTLHTREVLFEQVQELTRNKLKSELDVSFAQVNLEEGKLLLAKAQNDLEAAQTELFMLLGFREPQRFQLVDEPAPIPFTNVVSDSIRMALERRPELLRLRFEKEAADKLASAEGKLFFPTISAVGGAGVVPVHDSHLPDKYAAAGVNLNLPLFAGGLYTARKREAQLKAKAAQDLLKDQENNVIRDVRVAALNAAYAWERVGLTGKLASHASQAFELAQTRYNLGSSSIVELSQAQLAKTSADIGQANAKYHYLLQRAVLDFQTSKPR